MSILPAFVLALCACAAQGKYWTRVSNTNSYPANRATINSSQDGTNTVCRFKPSGSSWQIPGGNRVDQPFNTCWAAYNGGKVQTMPFEVYHFEPLTEKNGWRNNADRSLYQSQGVRVEDNGPYYVCARNDWGVGKFNSGNEQCCAVNHNTLAEVCSGRSSSVYALAPTRANSYDLTQVTHRYNEARKTEDNLYEAPSKVVPNPNSFTISGTLEINKFYSTEYSYEVDKTFHAETSFTMTVGLPRFVNGEWSSSASATYNSRYGRKETSSTRYTNTMIVSVPPGQTCTLTTYVYGHRYTVPYRGYIYNRWADGTYNQGWVDGEYKGIPGITFVEDYNCRPLLKSEIDELLAAQENEN